MKNAKQSNEKYFKDYVIPIFPLSEKEFIDMAGIVILLELRSGKYTVVNMEKVNDIKRIKWKECTHFGYLESNNSEVRDQIYQNIIFLVRKSFLESEKFIPMN